MQKYENCEVSLIYTEGKVKIPEIIKKGKKGPI